MLLNLHKKQIFRSFYIILLLSVTILAVGCTGDSPSSQSQPTFQPTNTSSPSSTDQPTQDPTATPTPGSEADTSGTVVFSHKAGFYDEAFYLTLSAPEGYTIYYTTNSEDPRHTGRRTYSEPIMIEAADKIGSLSRGIAALFGYGVSNNGALNGVVIKAAAQNNETREWTPVYTNTYFTEEGLVEKYQLPVISISTKASTFGTKTGIYYTTMQKPFETKDRISAYAEIFDKEGVLQAEQYIEIALSGNGSLGNLQKSMRLYFKSTADPSVEGNPSALEYDIFQGRIDDINGKTITSYKHLLLRNSGNDCTSTFLRDFLAHRLSKELTAEVMEGQPVLVFINNEFWGMYNLRERHSSRYAEAHYGVQVENYAMLEAPTPLITGNSHSPYVLNEGTEQDLKDWNDLMTFVNTKNLADANNYKYVADRIDLVNLADYFTVCIYFCNTDWPGNNIKVWRNSNPDDISGLDTKWRFCLLDLDFGLGLATSPSHNMMGNINANTVITKLFKSLLNNEEFKSLFVERFYYAVENYFDASIAVPVLESMAAEIEEAMKLNFKRWSAAGNNYANWKSQIQVVKDFLEKRASHALSHFNNFLGVFPAEAIIFSDPEEVQVTFGGNKLTEYTSHFDYKSGTSAKEIKINVKNGYTYLGCIVTNSSGNQRIYKETTFKISITDKVTINVLTQKTGQTKINDDDSLYSGSYALFYLNQYGDLYSWGNNDTSQLGVCMTGNTARPILVMTDVVQMATAHGGTAGDQPHTLILTLDNKLYTIGGNSNGQLGRSGDSAVLMLSDVPEGKIKAVSAGLDHSLVLMEDGKLYGVGNNTYGQLGSKNVGGSVSSYVLLAQNVRSMCAGRRHTLYITNDSKLYGLGDNRWNKLSDSSSDKFTSPQLISTNVKEVYAGQHSSVYLKNNNTLYYVGNLGQVSGLTKAEGASYKLLDNVVKASLVDGHVLMLTTTGDVYAWGDNSYSQSKPGSSSPITKPVKIYSNASDIAAGAGFSCIQTLSGELAIWGNNSEGILGTGSISNKVTSPVKSSISSLFSKISR